jgi:hypothetical protein
VENKNIYKKLFEFRKYMGKIVKSKVNPFTKSKYSDINSVLHATEPVLEELGLIFVDSVDNMVLKSSLIDVESGESLSSEMPLILVKNDPQAYGSALTYMRRYARVAMLSLETVDDDGSTATGQSFVKPKQIKQINTLVLEVGLKVDDILKRYGVNAIKDLYESNAVDLIANLEKIKGAKK